MTICNCNQGRLPCACRPAISDHNADECKRFAGERERFETWARNEGYSLSRDENGRLVSDVERAAWIGWKYRAAQPAPVVPGWHRLVSTDWLKQIHRDLDACQKLIWANLRGCDPAYCADAQARLAEIDAMLAAAPAQGQQVECLDVAAERNAMQRQRDQARDQLARECNDTDAILRIFGIDPDEARTDGGFLNVGKVRELAALKAQQAEQKPIDRDAIHLAFEHKLREVNLPIYGNYKGDWRSLTREETADVVLGLLAAPQPAPAQDVAGLIEALTEAAQSLETISNGAGRDEFMSDFGDVRGYARSRASVARAALAAHDKQSGGADV